MITKRILDQVFENLRSAKMALMSHAMVSGNESLYDIIDRDIKPAMDQVEYMIEVCPD